MWAYLRIMKEKRLFHHPSETTKRRWLGYIYFRHTQRYCQVSNICLEVLQKQETVSSHKGWSACFHRPQFVWWMLKWGKSCPQFLTKYGKPKSQSPSQMLSYMNASGEQICFMSMAACLSLIPPISSTWSQIKVPFQKKVKFQLLVLDNDALTSLLHCYYYLGADLFWDFFSFFFGHFFFLVCGLCACFLSSSRGVVGWCFCGGVFVVVFVWWCFCGGVVGWCFCGGVVVLLCFCGGVFVVVWWCFYVFVVVFLWWCFCVFVVVFLWWRFCGGVVVFLWCFLWWCFWGGVFGVVFLWWCFCGGVVGWCFCGGVCVVWLCFCGGVFVIVVVFLSLWWCFCSGVFVVVW